jgi:hypothetical protein
MGNNFVPYSNDFLKEKCEKELSIFLKGYRYFTLNKSEVINNYTNKMLKYFSIIQSNNKGDE